MGVIFFHLPKKTGPKTPLEKPSRGWTIQLHVLVIKPFGPSKIHGKMKATRVLFKWLLTYLYIDYRSCNFLVKTYKFKKTPHISSHGYGYSFPESGGSKSKNWKDEMGIPVPWDHEIVGNAGDISPKRLLGFQDPIWLLHIFGNGLVQKNPLMVMDGETPPSKVGTFPQLPDGESSNCSPVRITPPGEFPMKQTKKNGDRRRRGGEVFSDVCFCLYFFGGFWVLFIW